ncbi:zinc transporter ZIP3 isoform X1 [Sigmodon hispidus]
MAAPLFTDAGQSHESPALWLGPVAPEALLCDSHVWFGPVVSGVTQVATMTKLLVAKVLCMVGVFFFMLLGSLLPVKVIEADFEKAHRSKKVLSLCNTFGGGVFLATCFNALLPAVRDKVRARDQEGRRALGGGGGCPCACWPVDDVEHHPQWLSASVL